MNARKILTLSFLFSMIWGMLFILTSAVLGQVDRIGLFLSEVSFLSMAIGTYMKLKNNQGFSLFIGYLLAAFLIVLSVFLFWLLKFLENFAFPPTVFYLGFLGFLVINISAICLACYAQYHDVKSG